MNDKDSEIQEIGKLDYKKGYLTLPFSQDQFKEFISGLFGRSQELSREIMGEFAIELGDILNFYYLLEERIGQQNNGSLAQFSAKIFYDDNSSILLNSFNSLSNYVEPKALIPIRVELIWEYLIKFNDKNVPEKQQISIYISTSGSKATRFRSDFDNFPMYDGFALRIQYTARTWATDIDSMLTEYISSLVKSSVNRNQNKWKSIIFNNSERIGWIGGIVFFLFSVLGAFIATDRFMIVSREKAVNVLTNKTEINIKVDFLIRHIISGEISRFYFFLAIFLLIMLVTSISIGGLISNKADQHNPESFILLTQKSRNSRESALRRDRNKIRDFFLSILIAIIVNVFSSYLFVYLTTQKLMTLK
jgi:hypothetical protein